MTTAQKLLADFNRYFTSANDVAPNARITVPTGEWQKLHQSLAAILEQVAGAELPLLPGDDRLNERIKTLMQQCGLPDSHSLYGAFMQFKNEMLHEMVAYGKAAALTAQSSEGVGLYEALKEITEDYADRFDLKSLSTNPGIKSSIKQARAAIAAYEAKRGGVR